MDNTTGEVIFVLGNLIKVEFDKNLIQGEIGYVKVGEASLKAEVIEINGKVAKLQVFEDTRGIKYRQKVTFTKELLEIELGPGLLSQIFDGLQNPLEKIADVSGLYLERGVYVEALDRVKKWEFTPKATVGEKVYRGSILGSVPESHFTHQIFLPFNMYDEYEVISIAESGNYTVDTEIAKVKDFAGNEYSILMMQKWPVKFPLIEGKKVTPKEMICTGMRVIDTMTPMTKGGTACSPGPFGAGKTLLQQCISKYSNVDIVILAACGERAGEVVETLKTFPKLNDVHTGRPLMDRTCVICNTSSMPVAAREASVYVGVTIAEYYRQMGLDVLLLADSTSRWAQAMREMSGRLEEIPGEEAFPAYLASRIASFYERAGVVQTKETGNGSVSILGAVSPAGGNISSDPVSQETLKVVGVFLCLSRELSDARKYPAIDSMLSWSKYIEKVASLMKKNFPRWGEWVEQTRFITKEGDEIGRRMEVVGKEGISMDDYITFLKAELFSFSYLQQNAFDKEDVYCSLDQQQEQFRLINEIFEQRFAFASPDEAKDFFLELQNDLRNLNFLPFNTERYHSAISGVRDKLERIQVKESVH
ncbi:MAG: V-type ATP synthase alpha chain [Chlamydiia bacterium]|nr:V-type ATP synthase alpha chain [Chlamydiia bacterium]